jgi:hypothetical protein
MEQRGQTAMANVTWLRARESLRELFKPGDNAVVDLDG